MLALATFLLALGKFSSITEKVINQNSGTTSSLVMDLIIVTSV